MLHHTEKSDRAQKQNNRINKAQCPTEEQPLAVWQPFGLLIQPLCSMDTGYSNTTLSSKIIPQEQCFGYFIFCMECHLSGFLQVFFDPLTHHIISTRLTTAATFLNLEFIGLFFNYEKTTTKNNFAGKTSNTR